MTKGQAAPTRADPVERLAALWDGGAAPDLDHYLAEYLNLTPADLAAIVRVDQARRWQRGDRLPTEHYFARFPVIRDDPAAAMDLIHYEFILRENYGPPPSLGEFTARFPDHASTIHDQIAIHVALCERGRSRRCHSWKSIDKFSLLGFRQLAAACTAGEVWALHAPRTTRARHDGHRIQSADDHLDRHVALKVLRVGLDPDGHLASRFLREARIAASFTDPHLCPVHDAGVLNGFQYFTMPLIDGETLASCLVRDGAVDPTSAARLVLEIAYALSIAHRAGVVHRDLKPANVMMTADGSPVVLDFGLARRQAVHDAVATEDGVVLGTPAYMAPEQIGGDSRSVGPPADIYSLGVILYQLLTGRLPFEGSSHELLRKALTANPVPPSHLRPELDATIDTICLRAMAREITDRFPSMNAFADSLESYLHGAATAERRSWRRHLGRRRAVILGIGVILGFTAVALNFSPSRAPSVTARPDQAVHFPTGAIWSGRFVFRGRLSGYEGDVILTITESHGDRFQGKYSTEAGKFEWEVSGVERDDHIHWEFVRATRGEVRPSIVGRAHVSGHYRNGVLELIFTDGDSSADVILTRSP